MQRRYPVTVLIIFALSIFNNAYAYAVDIKSTQALYNKLLKKEQTNVDIQYFSEVIEDKSWRVLVYGIDNKQFHNDTQYFAIFKNDLLIFKYTPSDLADSFINFKWFIFNKGLPLVAIRWNRGAHSELFVLLDPIQKKVVHEVTASWPVSISRCENGLAIGIPIEANTDGKGIFNLSYWDHNHNTKTIQVSSLDQDNLCKQIGH